MDIERRDRRPGGDSRGNFQFQSEPSDLNLSRKPPETEGKRIRLLERTMVETNGETTPREMDETRLLSAPIVAARASAKNLQILPYFQNLNGIFKQRTLSCFLPPLLKVTNF